MPGNAGQIMKQLLIENGVDISGSSITYTKVRRKKRRYFPYLSSKTLQATLIS